MSSGAPTSNAPLISAIEWCAGVPGGKPEFRGARNPWRPARQFDLASLTKVIVTSTLVAETWIASNDSWDQFLARPIVRDWPELADVDSQLAHTTVGELWEHRSGLHAHTLIEGRPFEILQSRSVWRADRDTVYSDLGFLALGLWLERVRGCAIHELWESWKARHGIEATALSYGPLAAKHAVPTETRHSRGRVNDDNAASLGGVAPHAGLFGTLDDVWAWFNSLARWARSDARVRHWLAPVAGHGRFHGGWDTPSDPTTTHAGAKFPRGRVIGHLGYTGTALWWDVGAWLDAKIDSPGYAGVLLTNRVHPEASEASKVWIFGLRREFFDRLWTGTLKGWEPQV